MSESITTNLHRYERWSGELSRGRLTWLTIVTTGVRLAFKHSHVRGLVSMGLGFVVGTGIMFYLVSVVTTLVGNRPDSDLYDFLATFLGVDLSGVSHIADYQGMLWRSIFMLIIKVQLVWVLLIVARVGPGLIADDLKTRALPIYFARPLQPLTYVAGKWMVIAVFIALVMLVPNLLSLIVGVLMTGGPGGIRETLSLAGDLIASGFGIMVVGGMLVLALSTLGSDKRYVVIGWLAVCLLPWVAQEILNEALPPDKTLGFLGSISLHRDVLILTEWLFDLRQSWQATGLPSRVFEQALAPPIKPVYPAVVLGGMTLASGLVCYRRVVRFSRTAANV